MPSWSNTFKAAVIAALYLVFLFFLTAPLHSAKASELPDLGEPDHTLTALYATAIAAHALDWKQTRHISEHCDVWYERNPVLGRCPGAAAVNLWFAGTAAVILATASQLSDRNAKLLLGAWSVLEITVVQRNARMGIKLEF